MTNQKFAGRGRISETGLLLLEIKGAGCNKGKLSFYHIFSGRPYGRQQSEEALTRRDRGGNKRVYKSFELRVN